MDNPSEDLKQDVSFNDEERDSFYKVLYNRRDVRGQFKPDPVPDDVLARVLNAAHHAPSVGFMQPWNFCVISSPETKKKVHDIFITANEEAALMFEGEKREEYRNLKLEGILESPLNICITCDRTRSGPVVLGRTHMKDMDIYSSVCAVQNLWLAARAEGLGMGWVSIADQDALQQALAIPKDIVPIAYLCLGYVTHFYKKPELEVKGWLPKLSLEELVYFDSWGQKESEDSKGLLDEIKKNSL